MPTPEEERARQFVDKLPGMFPDAILIGGWGSWVLGYGAYSHDVDVITDPSQLGLWKAKAHDLSQSGHLAGGLKWKAEVDGVHVDIYVGYSSRLGDRLELRVERLVDDAIIVDGHRVLSLAAQIAAKWAALVDRLGTQRGDKDRQEIIRLMSQPGADGAVEVLLHASAKPPQEVIKQLEVGFDFLARDPQLSKQERAELRVCGRECMQRAQKLASAPEPLSPADAEPENGPSSGTRQELGR